MITEIHTHAAWAIWKAISRMYVSIFIHLLLQYERKQFSNLHAFISVCTVAISGENIQRMFPLIAGLASSYEEQGMQPPSPSLAPPLVNCRCMNMRISGNARLSKLSSGIAMILIYIYALRNRYRELRATLSFRDWESAKSQLVLRSATKIRQDFQHGPLIRRHPAGYHRIVPTFPTPRLNGNNRD